jgi:hypothetical protein
MFICIFRQNSKISDFWIGELRVIGDPNRCPGTPLRPTAKVGISVAQLLEELMLSGRKCSFR